MSLSEILQDPNYINNPFNYCIGVGRSTCGSKLLPGQSVCTKNYLFLTNAAETAARRDCRLGTGKPVNQKASPSCMRYELKSPANPTGPGTWKFSGCRRSRLSQLPWIRSSATPIRKVMSTSAQNTSRDFPTPCRESSQRQLVLRSELISFATSGVISWPFERSKCIHTTT